ncbi:Leucine rich repeat-containing protein [Lachnospiraceae bacterium]|nr:Leucine rich repeat-containing protein [Lachnospiraceae bacterium]
MKKKSICILLVVSFIVVLFYHVSSGSGIGMVNATPELTWSDDEVPIIIQTRTYGDQIFCLKCGCNISDLDIIYYHNQFGVYNLENTEYEVFQNKINNPEYVNPHYGTDNHTNPISGVSNCGLNGGNYQPIKGYPYHTSPEIAKIWPSFEMTCTKENWNMSIQGEELCLNYTGKEQHPIFRVLSDGKVLNEDTYTIFFRKVSDDYFGGSYDSKPDSPYDAIRESDNVKLYKLYKADDVPVSDECIEEGRYAAVLRFKSNSDFRGQMVLYFVIMKPQELYPDDPTQAPTPVPTQAPTATPTTKPTTSPSTSPSPTPTVETTTATETEVTTKEKVKAGDTFVSKTAQYTITSGSTLTYDKPVGSGKTAKIPDSIKVNKKTYKVTAVSEQAFYNNKKLKKLTIGKNVTTIGRNAFSSCTKLDSVSFKCKNLTTIESGAFKGCKGIKSISISSKKLKSIGASSFYGCKNLKTVTIKSTKVKFGKNSFKGIYKKATFKVPKSKVKSYKKKLTKTAKAPSKITVKKY